MALIDFEVHSNEMEERNALIQEARGLFLKTKEVGKGEPDKKVVADLAKSITKFLNDSAHKKYENATDTT